MLSQFFILSTRGDTIIKRDCKFVVDSHPYVKTIAEWLSLIVRFDMNKQTSEIFFRKVKFWPGDPPPTFVSMVIATKQEALTSSELSILSRALLSQFVWLFSTWTVSTTSLQRSLASTLLQQVRQMLLQAPSWTSSIAWWRSSVTTVACSMRRASARTLCSSTRSSTRWSTMDMRSLWPQKTSDNSSSMSQCLSSPRLRQRSQRQAGDQSSSSQAQLPLQPYRSQSQSSTPRRQRQTRSSLTSSRN